MAELPQQIKFQKKHWKFPPSYNFPTVTNLSKINQLVIQIRINPRFKNKQPFPPTFPSQFLTKFHISSKQPFPINTFTFLYISFECPNDPSKSILALIVILTLLTTTLLILTIIYGTQILLQTNAS